MTDSSVGQFYSGVDAVLSQNFIQHGKNLLQSNPPALQQTGNQLDVTDRCIVNFRSEIIIVGFSTAWVRQTILLTTGIIQLLFLYLAFFALVIFSASAGGFLAPVSFPAAERTAKINTLHSGDG